jgi:hypothetical protein
MSTVALDQPTSGDVLIHKIAHATYVLCVGDQTCGQYFQWYRVFDEAMRLSAARGVAVWIREDGADTLLYRCGPYRGAQPVLGEPSARERSWRTGAAADPVTTTSGLRRIVDDLTGRSLLRGARNLEEVEKFERE